MDASKLGASGFNLLDLMGWSDSCIMPAVEVVAVGHDLSADAVFMLDVVCDEAAACLMAWEGRSSSGFEILTGVRFGRV